MYRKIRVRLLELGMEHRYLAKKLGMCPASLSGRMTGRFAWTIDDMYKVMDIMRVPYEELHEYFPKGGVDQNVSKLTLAKQA